jgi:hypothetical protein
VSTPSPNHTTITAYTSQHPPTPSTHSLNILSQSNPALQPSPSCSHSKHIGLETTTPLNTALMCIPSPFTIHTAAKHATSFILHSLKNGPCMPHPTANIYEKKTRNYRLQSTTKPGMRAEQLHLQFARQPSPTAGPPPRGQSRHQHLQGRFGLHTAAPPR